MENSTSKNSISNVSEANVPEHRLWDAYEKMARPLLSILHGESETFFRPGQRSLLPSLEKPILNYLILGQRDDTNEKFFKELVDTTSKDLEAERNRVDTLYSIGQTWFKENNDSVLIDEERKILCSFEKELSSNTLSIYSTHDFNKWIEFLITTTGTEANGWFLSPYIYEYHLSRIFTELMNKAKNENHDPKQVIPWPLYDDILPESEISKVKKIFEVALDVWIRSQPKDPEEKLLQLILSSTGPYRDYDMTVEQVDYLTKSINNNPQNFDSEFYWRIRFAFDETTLYEIKSGKLPKLKDAIKNLTLAMHNASEYLAAIDNTKIKRQNIERGLTGKNGLETILHI
ncbi:hypothetical protein HAU32_07845 [Weissella confusa]|uniref:Uncharacterized protein n=1 Tax=Weissella fermenti TaxID=2987699 RepID=A0ABT6D036_9LACO|nr:MULTISPECIES: hypothetical protein [Weissella]MBJ7688884.1 hypothetical protein [Weissella confusa]MDF9298753.1 hypothetical protein [Weissella sp. BK2]